MLVIGVLHVVKILFWQVELLSLMSTADIRAIGADVLLTWGGRILTGLTHPQVCVEGWSYGLVALRGGCVSVADP
jgi:hypothetical protein